MNPSIFVSVSKEPGISTAERENIRYDDFVRKLLKPLPENLNACHIAMGLAGELCELAGTNVDEFEEYGDFEFYLQALLNHYSLVESSCPIPNPDTVIVDLNTFVQYTGELIDAVKREYIYEKPRELNRIITAIGYIYTFLYHEYNGMGTSRAEILQANAIKLEKRYAGLYYSDEAAIARADKS